MHWYPFLFREDSDSWIMEEKLEAHTDWVRDVAWAPSIGLPRSRLASCSQVSQLICSGITWNTAVLGLQGDLVDKG